LFQTKFSLYLNCNFDEFLDYMTIQMDKYGQRVKEF
jgi:hypothetical protein